MILHMDLHSPVCSAVLTFSKLFTVPRYGMPSFGVGLSGRMEHMFEV